MFTPSHPTPLFVVWLCIMIGLRNRLELDFIQFVLHHKYPEGLKSTKRDAEVQ